MRRLRTGNLERLVTFVLAMSISVCCCQAHFLLHGFERHGFERHGFELHGLEGTEPARTNGMAADPDGCCSGCTDDVRADAQGGDRPAAPPQSCKSCCVKGSGLKDGVKIPPPTLADVLPGLAQATTIVSTSPVNRASPAMTLPPFVAPRTLLRLRCALIV